MGVALRHGLRFDTRSEVPPGRRHHSNLVDAALCFLANEAPNLAVLALCNDCFHRSDPLCNHHLPLQLDRLVNLVGPDPLEMLLP